MSETEINFSPGPSMLPDTVKQQIEEEWSGWRGTSFSVVELSHRGEHFLSLFDCLKERIRRLLNVPDDYEVLLMHAGANAQFSAVPMNLLGNNPHADYLIYGHWAKRAFEEAKRYGDVQAQTILLQQEKMSILPQQKYTTRDNIAYLHYCSNETMSGLMLPYVPQSDAPVVVDMSSDLFSKAINVNQYGLIYACAQKNFGIAGLALVIVKKELLQQAQAITPSVFDYAKQAKAQSLLNTVNTFACYVAELVLAWLEEQGGIDVIEEKSQAKAKAVYALIDQCDCYQNIIAKECRSNMSVVFDLPDEKRLHQFLDGAAKCGLMFLRGHRIQGGVRASLYNAMPQSGVDRLLDYMRQFAAKPMNNRN